VNRQASALGIGAALALVLALSACGGGKQGASATDTTKYSNQTATESTAASGEKPQVEVPDGPPPDRLEVKDLKTGTGPPAKPGDQLTVNYVGVLYDGGQEFDNSYDKGQPFPFQLGSGQVIPGWDRGLVGIKKGGRRELIIPPDLAYGAQGQPPTIPADATLIFIIDLLDIQPG
jgi:FKBP-type peptidyl-prolyl cis-trans isomerase